MLRPALLAVLLLLAPRHGVEAQEGKPGMVELSGDGFAATFKGLPDDRWVLLEFYAHWCPACQRFQPEYEKVAAFLAERGEQEPVVMVARLDCANFAAMCNKFGVSGYPTMRLGTAGDLAALAVDKLTDVRPASRHASSVIAFLAKQLDVKFDAASSGGSSDGGNEGKGGGDGGASAAGSGKASRKLDPGRGSADSAAGQGGEQQAGGASGGGAAVPGGADLNDVEGATIRAWQYMAASPLLLKGPEARQGLKDWVDLLADYHPTNRRGGCRQGAERLQEALDEAWPDDQDQPTRSMADLQICPGTTFKEWRGCLGATPGSRGYTCGLWQLFHTLASRLPEGDNAGAVWLAAVKGFVGNYFQCTDCAKHFMAHATRPEALAVATKRDAVLWLWRTHNIVNRRLRVEEKAAPPPAHAQFPPAALCSKCRRTAGSGEGGDEEVEWDEDAVYAFLLAHYSGEQPEEVAAAAGPKARRTSWSDAGLLVALVAACVYAILRRSSQYALRKSESRVL